MQDFLQSLNKEQGQPVTQKGKISRWLSGKDFWRQSEGECCGEQLLGNLLISWWWCNWKPTSSTFFYHLVYGLLASGQHAVYFFHLVGVSVSTNSLRIWLRILSVALEEVFKVLEFDEWLNYYYCLLLDCFPIFSYFLFIFILWNLRKA